MTAQTSAPTAPDLATVTVNGVERQFPKGQNLLAALLGADVYVPHYCWHPSLSIAGNCRLCMVEIEGQPRPSVSCNMTCTDGLKIKTEGPMVEDCRKGMMEFLLVQHPLDCPICDRGGECMLQRYSRDYGFGTSRMADERRRFEKPQFDPLIDIERNRCIMCTRCVRFMDEVGGEKLLGVFNRGNRNYIGTYGNGPVDNVFSGNIVDLCPVGCLTSKPFRFQARAWELQQTGSTCTLCSAGCPTTTWLRDGKVYRVTPPARKYGSEFTIDEDTTRFICNEGRFGNYYANADDRLLRASVRRPDGVAEPADWKTALQTAADALRGAAPNKVAILTGARQTNEEYFLLARLARSVLGVKQIDWRLDAVSDAAADAVSLALSASDGDLDALDVKGYGATLLIGADLLDTIPVIGLKVKEAARLRKTRLAVLDSRLDGWLSDYAEAASIVPPESLGEATLMVADSLGGEEAEGLPAGLRKIKDLLSVNPTGLIVLGLDTAGATLAPEVLPGIFALLEKLGDGWDFLPVFRARNGKGAFAAGAQADRLPGGPLGDTSARNALAEVWGAVKLDGDTTPESAPSAYRILERAAAGEIETLFLHRCDELVYGPLRPLVEKALAATRNVVVVDVFPSWIAERATVVLPGALWFETRGSLVSADGTLESLEQGNEPPGDAQEDWRILATLIEFLGGGKIEPDPDAIFRDLLACWKPAKRFRLTDLKLDAPGSEHPQRPQAAFRKKTKPDFKLRFSARPDLDDPPGAIQAASGKLRLVWHYAIQGWDHLGSRSEEFDALRPEAALELNPDDAAAKGLSEGDFVKIEGARARVCNLRLNPTLPRGVARGAANVLGLELAPDATGLPEIEIAKTDPPAKVD